MWIKMLIQKQFFNQFKQKILCKCNALHVASDSEQMKLPKNNTKFEYSVLFLDN